MLRAFTRSSTPKYMATAVTWVAGKTGFLVSVDGVPTTFAVIDLLYDYQSKKTMWVSVMSDLEGATHSCSPHWLMVQKLPIEVKLVGFPAWAREHVLREPAKVLDHYLHNHVTGNPPWMGKIANAQMHQDEEEEEEEETTKKAGKKGKSRGTKKPLLAHRKLRLPVKPNRKRWRPNTRKRTPLFLRRWLG